MYTGPVRLLSPDTLSTINLQEMILEKGVDVNHAGLRACPTTMQGCHESGKPSDRCSFLADYLGFTALHTCAFANAGKPCKMLIDR